MDADDVLDVLQRAADAVVEVFAEHGDWGKSGLRDDQYVSDVVADGAILPVFADAGIRVLSEESGLGPGTGPVAVVDPLDGSTNGSLGLPWFATSICVVDDDGPWVALVHDHPNRRRYTAMRGGGAHLDGVRLDPPEAVALKAAVVAVNGVPPSQPGWWQFRCMGASALDLCAVADGRFAGSVDFDETLGPWDYLGGMLVCSEVGIDTVDAWGRDLVVIDHTARRSPVAAPAGLLEELLRVRRIPAES